MFSCEEISFCSQQPAAFIYRVWNYSQDISDNLECIKLAFQLNSFRAGHVILKPGINTKYFVILGREGHAYSNSSFLFSLRNKDNLAPFIANIKQGEEGKAIYRAQTFGPWFGNNDLLIWNNSTYNQKSYCNFGQAYQLPPVPAKKLLAVEFKFLTSEIEVFN